MESYMTIDGQWGSTGKGLLNGYLAYIRKPDTVACNFGPNAGHTVVFDGITVVTCQLPTAAVFPSAHTILIGPGAVIDFAKLKSEINLGTEFTIITQPVFDSENHLSGGVVQMRLYKAGNGNTNNHYYIDWVAIVDGLGTPSGVEIDPFCVLQNGLHGFFILRCKN